MFMTCAGLSAQQASAAWRARLENAAARNPRRAMRAAHSLPSELPDLSRVFRLHYAADVAEEEAAALYAADPMVEYAHPDYPQELAYVPDDPYFFTANSWNNFVGLDLDDLWGLKAINAPAAWDLTMGEDTVIAVVDTGVDRTHPDIADNIWNNPGEVANNGVDDDGNGFVDDVWGWDFVGNDGNPSDGHGHGTHVAGIAAGVGDNGIGVLGVAPHAKIMALRTFSQDEGSTAGAQAIVYAAENGADVINNSWGLRAIPGGGVLDEAVDTALALGSVVVFAGANGDFTISATPWWRHQGAITVSKAYAPLGHTAFSAADVDIAAPGSNILSLRGGNGIDGAIVGTDYVVGTGTSMAAPHVAGAAALLLSVLPELTPSEVKWHLEAAAAQWGMAGWEGLPWTPRSGWGLLDLTHAFDPLAVTTRLDRHTTLERHELVSDLSAPITIGHSFTTHDVVGWSASGSPWVSVDPAMGFSDGTVELTIDPSGAGVGLHDGSYQLSALSTADGGATLPVRLYAYPDATMTSGTVLNAQLGGIGSLGINGSTGVASATHAVLAWNSLRDWEAQGAVVDGAGNLVSAFSLGSTMPGFDIDSAFDGRRFGLVWLEYSERRYHLLTSRLAADGTLLDSKPREIGASSKWWWEPAIAFDGRRYLVVWTEVSTESGGENSKLLMMTMGPDFAPREKKPVVLYQGNVGGASRSAGKVSIACGQSSCLAVWKDATGLVDVVRALRFADGVPTGGPFDLVASTGVLEPQIAASGDEYLVLTGEEQVYPCGPTRENWCTKKLFGIRVNAVGQVLDASPRELITAPVVDSPLGIVPGEMTFDGEQYLLPYTLSNGCYRGCTSAVFVTRVAPDGTVLDQDAPRPSLLASPTRDREEFDPVVAATADGVTVAWSGWPRDPVTRVPNQMTLEARTLAAHSTDVLPLLEIGTIGSIALSEADRFQVRLIAPGLSSSSLTFSAEGLPDGAVLDPARGILHWAPAPSQAGVYGGIRLVADDGSAALEETVSITVGNAFSSLSGTVREIDSSPVGGVAVTVKGRGFRRTTMSEPDGRFAFFDLAAGDYRLAVGRESRKNWRAKSLQATLATATADVGGQDLVVTPR